MIQTPDFKERQIFFIDAVKIPDCGLSLRNENIFIKTEGKTKNKIPISKLIAIFIIGDMTITSKLLQKISRSGASLYFLKRNFETYASMGSYAEGNYLLRQKQYKLSQGKSLEMSKNIVLNKLKNSIALLRGAKIKNIGPKTRIKYKKVMMDKIKNTSGIASLRGVEGTISKDYFGAYFAQINWYRRIPRGKIDENNILLDMGYNFLFHFIDSILRVYGFDTYKGIYHQLFFQRKSLACDMVEPFRCIIDKTLVKMHTLKQFDKRDFSQSKGQYYLSYKHSGKYAQIFLKEILRYKMDIYNYIRDYYYLILNDEGEVKDFTIR
jgi:CRISPR-associated endonuclease Cas1